MELPPSQSYKSITCHMGSQRYLPSDTSEHTPP